MGLGGWPPAWRRQPETGVLHKGDNPVLLPAWDSERGGSRDVMDVRF